MSKNIEIKACYDDLDFAGSQARKLNCELVGRDAQTDTYFNTSNGRFKLRESTLSGSYLVPYLRPDSAEAKESDYLKIPVDEPQKVKEIFSKIWGIRCVVEKVRKIYLYQNVRIHLDTVSELGTFIELEAVCNDRSDPERERKKIEYLSDLFKIKKSDLLSGSYSEMILKR